MTTSRLLGPLVDAIETARRQMLERRRDLTANETRTRNALIDPVLKALDWDVSNSSQVTTEYDLPSGRVDYALLGSEGNVIAVIEAKKLGEGLESHRGQLVRYAFESKPAYAVLTNGDVWELYGVVTSEKEFHLEQLVEYPISENDPLQSARKLLVLWKANLVSIQADEEPDPTPEEKPKPVSAPELPVLPIPPQGEEDWVTLSTFMPKLGDDSPEYIRFPGEEPRHLDSWRSWTVETANWLYDTGKIKALGAPYRFGKTGAGVINTNKKNASGKDMVAPHQIGNQHLYVEKNGNCVAQVKRVRALLDSLTSIDAATVHIQLSG